MANNNKGLSFNPFQTTGNTINSGMPGYVDLTKYAPKSTRTPKKTTQIADNYFSTPSGNNTINIQWNPTAYAKAQQFVQDVVNGGKPEWDPMYYLNKWDAGFSGLNKEEKEAFKNRNADLINGKDDAWIDRLWRNGEFINKYGIDAFNSHNAEERDAAMEDIYASKAIETKFAGNDNLNQLLSLTPKGKRELLNSDYKSEYALHQEDEKEDDKKWWDYSLGERWNAVKNATVSKGEAGAAAGGVLGGIFGTSLFGIGGMGGYGAGTLLGGSIGIVDGILTGLWNPEDAGDTNISERREDNNNILSKITVSDNERKKEDSKEIIDAVANQYMQSYSNGETTADEINRRFDDLFLNGQRTETDELGNSQTYDYKGSNYYSAFKDTDEFEHYGITDKIKAIAQAEVLASKYGQGTAMEIAEQDMQNVVSANQSGWEWAGNTLKNVWVGGLANLGQKTTALGALAAKTYYGTKGALENSTIGEDYWDNYEKYGNQALANYLEGKDASGDGSDNSNIFNPKYWDKVDQYNTLGWGEGENDEMDRADANGGISKYTNVYKPGTENDFWSWSTLNNAVAMNKFAWSDLLTNIGLAKLVKGATRLAGGYELAPGVLSTESSTASQIVNKVGSFGVLNASSLGIDAAYGMQTYNDVLDKNNAKLDQIVQKDTDTEVARRLETPEAQEEFRTYVDQENARRKANAGESGKWIPVDEEKAWGDYANLVERRVKAEQEQLHKEDREEAKREAADAFATDATIEHLRMAGTAGLFKSYLFDKGTLNALKMNNPFVNTTVRDGAYAVAKHATAKKAAGIFAQNVFGGFHSNYYDDITVGFAESFGLQEYNNYLLSKYNPAAYGSAIDEYVNPFVAGMTGAENAMEAKRSFLDGGIGAIGSVFTFGFNPQAFSHSEIMKQAKEQAEADKKAGNKVSAYTNLEKLSHFVTNPIIQAVADARSATRMTEREINRINSIIKDNAYSLDNIVESANALNMKAITREGTSLIEAEDAKDKEAFTLASQLLSMKNSGVVVNAQVEPEKAKWYSKKNASRLISKGLDIMLGANVFEQSESAYTRAMQALQDAAHIDEESSSEETINRRRQLVDTFNGLDANKNVLEGKSKEEKDAYAVERLKKNATNLLNMMDRIEKIQQKFENSTGVNSMHPDVKQQLIYQYALDKRWKDRLRDIESRISGEETTEEDIDKWYNEHVKSYQEENSAIAKYGSKVGYDRAYKAQEKKVQKAKEEHMKAVLELDKDADPTKSTMQNVITNALRRMIEKSAKETLEKETAKLKEISSEGDMFKTNTEEGKTTTLPVIKAEDILKLAPNDRLTMLDDFYRSDYSAEQQAEIDKAKSILMKDGASLTAVMEDLRDAAILSNRINDNMAVAKRIMKNPFMANLLQQALKRNRATKIIDYFDDKVVAEAFQEFVKDPASTLSEDAVYNKVKDYSTAILNGMQKAANKLLKQSNRDSNVSDKTLDIITNGIEKAMKERMGRAKDTVGIDSFLKKTKKISRTEVTNRQEVVQDPENPGIITTQVIPIQTTTEQELSQNDKKLLEYAIDYSVEKDIPLDKLAEAVESKEFNDYVSERNHSYQMGLDARTMSVKEQATMLEDQANIVSPEYMKNLVKDVIDAYNKNKDAVAEATKEKETTKAASVATDPVETKGAKSKEETDEKKVKHDEPSPEDPLNLKKEVKEEPSGKPEEAAEAKEEEKDESEAKNEEILKSAETFNSDLLGDITRLLEKIDKMSMDEETRNTIKDSIQGLVASRTFNSIKELQNAIYGDLVATSPQVALKASIIAKLEIKKGEKAKTEVKNEGEEESPLPLKPAPMLLSTMDLDFFINNPNFKPQSDYIKQHGIVGFIQRLSNFWNSSKENYEKIHKGQVVFLHDSELATQIKESMEKAGMEYHSEMSSPIVMALEITDANKHLVEDNSQLVEVKDVPDGMSHFYMPLGFMPANDNVRDANTAGRMSQIRNAVNYSLNGTQIIRYTSNSGRLGKGGAIKTNISSIETHTDEESIPHGTEETPKTNTSQLMDENIQSETEKLLEATTEEKEAYEKAKQEALAEGKAAKKLKNPLYKRIRDAFIKRLTVQEKKATEEGEKDRRYIAFKVQKGTHSSYPKIVLTKKISETLDKNTGRPIIDILRSITTTGDNAEELINSNSRFKRLFNRLAKTAIDTSSLKSLIDAEGNVRNQAAYNKIMSDYANEVKNAIDDNLNVDELSTTAITEQVNGETIIKVNVYSGTQTEENLLSTLTTKGKISEAEFGIFMKDLILDENNNTRPALKYRNEERVKWQVNYNDANKANDSSITKSEREYAQKNLEDLYDDGIFEMQVTKLAYPARSVTVDINNKMRSTLYDTPTPEKVAPIEEHPVGEHDAKDGKVDGDTGALLDPTREEVKKAIPTNILEAVRKLVEMSRNRNLTPDGTHYDIMGQLWARVTSIKHTLPGILRDRFKETNGWGLPSTSIGNSFDEFGRDVFNGLFEGKTEAERLSEFENYDNSTAQNYAEAYQRLKEFELRLLNKGQIIVSTFDKSSEEQGKITAKGILNVLVNGKDGLQTKQVRVAGTLDVLAIDKDGNLHIYDFKTTRSKLDAEIASSEKKGYDRQLSMYASFLEDELAPFGIKVASINIIPIDVTYPTPSGVDNTGNTITGAQKTYKESRPGSNQLMTKDIGADDSTYQEFKGANFQVQKEFPLTRLTGDALTASFEDMTEDEKKALVEAVNEQHEDEHIDKVEGAKPKKENAEDNEEHAANDDKSSALAKLRAQKLASKSKVNTSAEGTANAITNGEKGVLARIDKTQEECGK